MGEQVVRRADRLRVACVPTGQLNVQMGCPDHADRVPTRAV
jgi:hypothetical protein